MNFDVSERIESDYPLEVVVARAAEKFGVVSQSLVPLSASAFRAKSIEATFGSINRNDDTIVEVREAEGGWFLTAHVHYRPSVMFWVFIALSLFLYVSWIFSVVFYFLQKDAVRRAVANCLKQVNDELRRPSQSPSHGASSSHGASPLERLAQLAELKERGHLTDQEFAEQKGRILGSV